MKPGQRVAVTRTVYGSPTLALGTVVDIPSEELVRVRLDNQDSGSNVLDVAAVQSVPDAVRRLVIDLHDLLAEVTPEENLEVERLLHVWGLTVCVRAER